MHKMVSGTNPGHKKAIRRLSPSLENKTIFQLGSLLNPLFQFQPLFQAKKTHILHYAHHIRGRHGASGKSSQQSKTLVQQLADKYKALQVILDGLRELFEKAQAGDVGSWEHMNGVTEELLKALEFKKDDDPWWHNMKRAHAKSKEGLEDLKRSLGDGAGI